MANFQRPRVFATMGRLNEFPGRTPVVGDGSAALMNRIK